MQWNNNMKTVVRDVPVNQLLTIDSQQAQEVVPAKEEIESLFTDITSASGIGYRHAEMDFIDFNYQRLLPTSFRSMVRTGSGDVNETDAMILLRAGTP